MARKKVPASIYLTLEQRDALKVLTERTRVPAAELIRQGIDLMFAREADRERRMQAAGVPAGR